MILIAANIAIAIGCFIILLSSINFAKTKDLFSQIHFVLISNIYGLSFLLLGLAVRYFSLQNITKTIIIILLNILITIIICHCVTRRAIINKINPLGETEKLDYLKEEIDE